LANRKKLAVFRNGNIPRWKRQNCAARPWGIHRHVQSELCDIESHITGVIEIWLKSSRNLEFAMGMPRPFGPAPKNPIGIRDQKQLRN
jgi:hypothetical protein